jgi:hypothetical protein
MAYNEGAGPESAEVCSEMAERIEKALPDDPQGISIEATSFRVTEDGRFVDLAEARANPHLVTRPAYRATRDALVDWVKFLRHCGGFQVF